MTKNPKLSNFQRFYAISVIIPTDSMDYNVENVHQGNNSLYSNFSFLNEKIVKLTKIPKNFNYRSFYAIFFQSFAKLRKL